MTVAPRLQFGLQFITGAAKVTGVHARVLTCGANAYEPS